MFLWANRHLRGARLIATGAIANTVAIAANAGIMPASVTAQRIAGLATGTGFQNSAHLTHPHLLWLSDIIPVPGPWPLGNVLSIGDLVIYAGMLVLLHNACRTHTSPQLHAAPTAERDSYRNHEGIGGEIREDDRPFGPVSPSG